MTHQEIIEAINVLTQVVKVNSDAHGVIPDNAVVKAANAKILELMERLPFQ